MQIVIEILKYIYDTIVASDSYIADCDNEKVGMAIKNGIPLPKSYGDLIDRNELLKQPLNDINYPSNYVRIAKTIIPATEEKSCDTCQFDGMCLSNVRLLVKHNGCTTWTPKQTAKEEGEE